ncbi:MAG TPA: hypothetical protein VGG25_29805 [Streptosporangiaceae bacterium]
MLCLYDSRVGQTTAVRPGRSRELLIWTWAPIAGRPGVADIRRLLVADLIRRTVQMHKLAATSWWAAGPGGGTASDPAAGERALLTDCEELNIYPPQYPPASEDGPGRAADVAVSGGEGEDPGAGLGVVTGPVQAASSAEILPWVAGLGADPLALRLALLRCHYREPATVTPGALAQADADLRDWRWQVAGWATQSSKPISAAYRARVTAAFDNDLDVPGALAELAELAADDEVPQGARFETFAHLDQLLGLDLAREVGHAPPATH